MSISLNANFELLSAGLYLDDRQQFNTIIEMKDFAETSIPDGFITYNKETQKHYVFSSSNTVDATLGKWREYNTGEGSSEKQIKDWVSGSSYLEGDYIYHEGELYRCLASNSDVDFDESNWEQITYGIDELSKEDVEGLLGLTKEEIEAMADLILDTEVRIDKTYSSSKIYTDIQQCLEDSKTYTLEEIARASTASYKVVTDVVDMTEEKYLYLLYDGTTNYDIYIVETDGTPTKIGNTQIDLSNYYTKTEIDNDFLKKVDADSKYATITTVDGKVDKDKIVTALNDTVTDEQVASALLTKTELDKTNAKLGELSDSLVNKKDFRIFKSLEEFNEKKGTSFTVVSGVDNMVDIANAMSEGDMLIITTKYYTGSEIYFGLDCNTGWTKMFTLTRTGVICDIKCTTSAEKNLRRVLIEGSTLTDWKELVTTDKVVKKIFIKDTSSEDAKVLIQKHWSEFDKFEFYNVRLETAKWTWNAEIYAHTQDYGTVLLMSYGSDVPNIFYGKLYDGVWTWEAIGKACTTTVADVSKTLIPLFPNVVKVASGGVTISYIVRNGWCNVNFKFNITSSTTFSWTDIAWGLPIPANSIDTVLMSDGKAMQPIPIKITSTGSVSSKVISSISTTDWWTGNITYPVAE